MLLDELLIKVGFNADTATMQQFEQLLALMGNSASETSEKLGDFISSLGRISDEVTEQVKNMPEFDNLFQSFEELAQAQENLSENEALDAWVQKIIESDELLQHFGEGLIDNSEHLSQSLIEAGANSEQVALVLAKLKTAVEQSQQATEKDTKALIDNADALKEDAEQAENLGEKLLGLFATKYGADQLISKFEFFGITLNKTLLKATALGAAFSFAVVGIQRFVDNQLTALDEIHQLSNVTGEAANNIYLLGKVAEVNGSSMEAAQSSIDGLSRTIGEAVSGLGRGAKAFEAYGLSATDTSGKVKSTNQLLGEISDKMQSMSNQEQIAMLAKLGIDASFIQTLQLGNEELQKAIKNANKLTLGVGNAENAKTAAEFKDSMTELSQIFKAMGEFVALRVAPSIQRLIERFKAWFLENNDLVQGVLTGFGKVFSFLFELAGAVDNIVSSTVGWKAVIYAVGAAMIWLSRQMLLAFATDPIFLTIAAITALVLLVDDFITYLKGGETALGDFWEPLAQVFDWVVEKIAWVKNAFKHHLPEALLASGLGLALFGRQFAQLGLMFGKVLGLVSRLSGLSSLFGMFGRLISIIRAVGMALRLVFVSNPVGLVIAAVAALGYGIYKLIENWDDVKKAGLAFINAIKQKWDNLVALFESNPIEAIFSAVFDAITAPFQAAFAAVIAAWQLLTGQEINLEAVSEVFDGIKQAIIDSFAGAFNWVADKWNSLKSWIFGGDEKEININAKVNDTAKQASRVAETVANVGSYGAPETLAKSGAVNNSNTDNSVKNSNNKITTHITLNGSGNSEKDARMIADQSARAVSNQMSAVVG